MKLTIYIIFIILYVPASKMNIKHEIENTMKWGPFTFVFISAPSFCSVIFNETS